MKYAILLRNNYPGLNLYELKTLLETYNVNYKILKNYDNRLVILETEDRIEKILDRSVLIKILIELYYIIDKPEEISKLSWEFVSPPYYVKTIRIPKKNRRFENVTKIVADAIWNSIDNPSVDVKNPKTIVYVIVYKDILVIGKLVKEFKRDFQIRKPNIRPFFHPTSLKPEDARLMLNLAKVKEGDKIYDPFCGSGSILIEACLLGIEAIGSDIQDIMVEGAKLNLKKYCKGKWRVFKMDAKDMDKLNFKVNAIVTDPPYGKASKVYGEIVNLYKIFLEKAKKLLKDNGRIVMFIPNWLENEIDPKKFGYEILFKYKIRVHSKLTRILYVLKVPNCDI